MKENPGSVVLVTGASSGIGKATAEFLVKKGCRVYGTSRKAPTKPKAGHDAVDAQSGGFLDLIGLDVTSEASMEEVIQTILAIEGRIDVLVSNAGNGIAGSLEDTTVEEAKWQFETNFFGAFRMIRGVLPVMRKQGGGRIIVVSSVAGAISIPYQAMYSASKFALEGLVEALRLETAPFGLKASLVLPGDTKTGFTSGRQVAQGAKAEGPYSTMFKRSLARMEKDEMNGASPLLVAKTIHKVMQRRNPPVRVTVGIGYKAILFLKKLLPARIVELFVKLLYA